MLYRIRAMNAFKNTFVAKKPVSIVPTDSESELNTSASDRDANYGGIRRFMVVPGNISWPKTSKRSSVFTNVIFSESF